MKRIGVLACLFVGVCAAGCETSSARMVVETLVSVGAEQAVLRGDSLPSPTNRFDFNDTDQADLIIYSSLKARDDVKVTLRGSEPKLPERLRLWTAKTANSSQPATCDINTDPAFTAAIVAHALEVLGQVAIDAVRDYALYKPAENFSTILETDSAADGDLVGVRFVERGAKYEAALAEYTECN